MIYIFLFLLSFLLTYLVKNYAIKKSLVAYVNERSSHTAPIPHGGGVAVAIVWFVGLIYLYLNNLIASSLFWALFCGIIISVVSYIDDLFELSARVRLFTQALVAILGLYFLSGFNELYLFTFSIENQFITNIFAFFMVIWFINLYNFLDGIDGYAGSEAIFLGIAGYLLFGGAHFLVLIVAVSGFLVWNWHKAKIFMGDVGSTLLGYNVAIFTIYYANENSENFWIWIILFSLFWFDATLTLFRRYRNAERLSIAHKKHAYQRLNQSGWSHDKVVKWSIFINMILFIIADYISNTFIALALCIIVVYILVRLIDKKRIFN